MSVDGILQGRIDGLDLRLQTDLLLDAVKQAEGRPLGPLLDALAVADPLALAEVVCGTRSPGGAALILAALPHAERIEAVLSPRGAWPRLLELGGAEAALPVLTTAARRHPGASWLVALSRKVEGPRAGLAHLSACSHHPAFAQACRNHAEAGHVEGLVLAAGATGRAEPAAALLGVDRFDAMLRAAGAALDTAHDSPIIAQLAAVWGPEPDDLFVRVLPILRKKQAAESLRSHCRHLPKTARLLDLIIRGMVNAP